jgi:riboflavin kinase
MMLPFLVAKRTSNSRLLASSCSLLLLWASVPKTCAFAFPAVLPRSSSSSCRYASSLTKRPFLAQSTTPVVTVSLKMSSTNNENAKNNDSGFDEDKFTAKQKEVSSQIRNKDTEMDHLNHQQRVFDDLSAVFASGDTVPAALIPVYHHLTQKMLSTVKQQREDGVLLRNARNLTDDVESIPKTYRLLDVATGTGAFYEYYLAAAETEGVSVHITGVDLAPKMVDLALQHAASVLQVNAESKSTFDLSGKHEISVVQGDILQYASSTDGTDDSPQLFDVIVANACFGNFWDQAAVLQHLTSLLRVDGSLFITHPLGADFVLKLHNEDADTVPHLLPTIEQLRDQTLCLPLQVSEFTEQADMIDAEDMAAIQSVPVYYGAMKRVRDSFLPHVIRLRGNVDTGYGRGGKKLGFPTANLPSRLFQDALQDVPTGVYFGWAVLEDSTGAKKGRNTYQKAVVNVGYSPTFEGQENTEKIVEAHLIFDQPDDETSETTSIMEPADFYDETMRLQLHGFLRPEIKFPSFPALIAQIKTDVADAKAALDQETNMLLQSDRFLADACQTGESDGESETSSWVGTDGGDTTASWEFQDVKVALQHLR